MILLRPDYLVFKTADGDNIPCSAQEVTVELMGETAAMLDKQTVENAAEAVLHYFKTEKGQQAVSVTEFSEALERVLRDLGLNVKSADSLCASGQKARIVETDLEQLAGVSSGGFELLFFPLLRAEVQRRLDGTPVLLRFRGLRACVKQIAGAKRWSGRCQTLHDGIVEYLRTCLSSEKASAGCALVVW